MSLDEYNLHPIDKDEQNQQLRKVRNQKREREELVHWIMNDNVLIDWDENGNRKYYTIDKKLEKMYLTETLWELFVVFLCILACLVLITFVGWLNSDVNFIEFGLHLWGFK